ncbi:MAG: T9SS type A sorting domain-containing protein [Candidatus Kapabacteria bacterium]|nr:T9SS type A sorting domain-containing protein [Ignavibacteriota bacterium]MCW5884101.1 T9SS type A sorting domain-containing protein [Candidatus Kapabacteria bacterium]
MKILLLIFVCLVSANSLMSEMSREPKWISEFEFIKNTFSPLHTYGVGNKLHQNQLYDITNSNLIFEVDTTQNIITDYTGKTFFVIDPFYQTLHVYNTTNQLLIKELTYRNYIRNRAVSDSLMFEFDMDNQILRLWNIYEDKLIKENDLKASNNYKLIDSLIVFDHSFDGRFVRFARVLHPFASIIYDTQNEEFLPNFVNHFATLNFLNKSNKLIHIKRIQLDGDSIPFDYFRFYDLEERTYIKNIKIIPHKHYENEYLMFLISNCDDYLMFYIPYNFFTSSEYRVLDLVNDRYLDSSLSFFRTPIYFSTSLVVTQVHNQSAGYRIKTPTSVIDKPVNHELLVYPNPASDYISIIISEINHRVNPMVDKVQIFDMLGLEVISTPSAALTPTGEGNLRIDVSHLTAGVYFIRIGNKVEKFVKM